MRARTASVRCFLLVVSLTLTAHAQSWTLGAAALIPLADGYIARPTSSSRTQKVVPSARGHIHRLDTGWTSVAASAKAWLLGARLTGGISPLLLSVTTHQCSEDAIQRCRVKGPHGLSLVLRGEF